MPLNIFSYLGFRGHINNLLESYLRGRKFRIKSESKYCKYYSASRAVSQGRMLSPKLFSTYVHKFADVHPKCDSVRR